MVQAMPDRGFRAGPDPTRNSAPAHLRNRLPRDPVSLRTSLVDRLKMPRTQMTRITFGPFDLIAMICSDTTAFRGPPRLRMSPPPVLPDVVLCPAVSL